MADKDDIKEGKNYHPEIPAKNRAFFVKGSGALDWGMQNRLARIFNPDSGRTVMLAFDHGYAIRREILDERLEESNVKVVIKAKTPTVPRTSSAGGSDPAAFFLPLAGAAGLLLLLLIVMVLRVRSLSSQIASLRRAPQGKAPEPEKT